MSNQHTTTLNVKILSNAYYDDTSSDSEEQVDSDNGNRLLSNEFKSILQETCDTDKTENSTNSHTNKTYSHYDGIDSSDGILCMDSEINKSRVNGFEEQQLSSNNVNYLIFSSADEDYPNISENKNTQNLPCSSFWRENHDVNSIENYTETPRNKTRVQHILTDNKHFQPNINSTANNKTSSVSIPVIDTVENTSNIIQLKENNKISANLTKRAAYQFRLPKRCRIRRCNENSSRMNRLCWGPENFCNLFCSVNNNSDIKIWNVTSGETLHLQCMGKLKSEHSKGIHAVDWNSKNQHHLVTGGFDKQATVYDLCKGVTLSTFDTGDLCKAIAWSPGESRCFLTGGENCMKLWDARTPVSGVASRPVRTFTYKHQFGQVQDFFYTADGTSIISCNSEVTRNSSDRNIMVWDSLTAAVVSNQIYQEFYKCTRLRPHPFYASRFYAYSQAGYVAEFNLEKVKGERAVRPGAYKMNKHKRYESLETFCDSLGFSISYDGKFITMATRKGLLVCDMRTCQQVQLIADSTRGEKDNPGSQRESPTDVLCHPILDLMISAGSLGTIEMFY